MKAFFEKLFRPKKKVFEVINDWKDDLIWCPSQCYLDVEYKGRHFVIYLRWRHCDPWSAHLVECEPDGNFNMHNKNFNWIGLGIDNYTDEQLEECKKDAIQVVNKLLPTLQP